MFISFEKGSILVTCTHVLIIQRRETSIKLPDVSVVLLIFCPSYRKKVFKLNYNFPNTKLKLENICKRLLQLPDVNYVPIPKQIQ